MLALLVVQHSGRLISGSSAIVCCPCSSFDFPWSARCRSFLLVLFLLVSPVHWSSFPAVLVSSLLIFVFVTVSSWLTRPAGSPVEQIVLVSCSEWTAGPDSFSAAKFSRSDFLRRSRFFGLCLISSCTDFLLPSGLVAARLGFGLRTGARLPSRFPSSALGQPVSCSVSVLSQDFSALLIFAPADFGDLVVSSLRVCFMCPRLRSLTPVFCSLVLPLLFGSNSRLCEFLQVKLVSFSSHRIKRLEFF
jgi:hypothetical protein